MLVMAYVAPNQVEARYEGEKKPEMLCCALYWHGQFHWRCEGYRFVLEHALVFAESRQTDQVAVSLPPVI